MKTRLFISFGLSLLVSNFSMAQQVSTYAGIGEQSGSTLTPVNRTQAKFNLPYGIVFDGQGNLYISETGNHTISFMEGATEKIKIRLGGVGLPGYIDAAGMSSRFDTPKGMDVGPDNEIYVADWGNNIIRKIAKFQSISSAQMVSSIGKQGLGGHVNGNSSVAEFDKPTDVAVDASGNIYVADAGNHVIRKIDASGNVTTFAGQPGQTGNINGDKTAVAKFNAPTGVFVDANNDVYVADRMNSSIRKISGGLVTTVITGLNIPSDVVIQNNTYYITDNHRVWKYKTSLSTYAGADDNNIKGFEDNLGTWARFNITACIVLNNSLLYVADQENHVVRKIADCSVWKPTFTIGADGKTLTASAGKYFQWYLNGNIIDSAYMQTYVAIAAGDYYVQVTNEDDCTDISETKNVTLSSIYEFDKVDDLVVYPNPGNGIFTLKSNLTTAKEVKIVISDLLGKTIMESSENINKGFERAYDLRHLDSGIYFITMTLDNSKQVIKLVIE